MAFRIDANVYLLLLHQLGVGAIIYNVGTEDRCSQLAIDLLGVDILQFPVQDELIAFGAEVHGSLLTQEYEGEDFTVLFSSISDTFKKPQYQDVHSRLPFHDRRRKTYKDPCHREWYFPQGETSGTQPEVHCGYTGIAD
jgi:hypothetical protein